MNLLRTSGALAAATLTCTAALGGTAHAQTQQDGLVNVAIGDITVEDVNVGVAAAVVAQVCGINVGPVAVLGRAVDRSGATTTVCTTDQGPVTLSQN